MFKWYKQYKVNKIEKELHRIIRYNSHVAKCYEAYPNKGPLDEKFEIEFSDNHAIYMSYNEDLWNKFKDYGVNEELFNKHLETYKKAKYEYNNGKKRKKYIQEEKEERDKIDLYKKAILELKDEGKLHFNNMNLNGIKNKEE